MIDPRSRPPPEEPQSEVTRSERVSPVWRGLFALLIGGVVGMVFYALVHDPNAQRTTRAPSPVQSPCPIARL